MIGWERRVLLRHYLEQGMTKTELAERFGISRQTIYRWIRSGELDRDLSAAGVHYSARAPVATKLDRYRDILVSRLGEYPDLTAVRLFEEIKAAGYAGGYTQVKEYVRKVRPRAPEEPVVRYSLGLLRHLGRQYQGSVWARGQGPQQVSLVLEAIDGPLLQGAMRTDVGHVIEPVAGLIVQVLVRREGSAIEEARTRT